ncbi:hypothetical protein [Methanothermobacter tenebrarum]|uniref:Uncharacterized protein n=1 Tax=Methanothermobacter tenebrarum TaxID=680118 RepID=A0A328PC30_9EURY|nr:hypothetical protein [Methanothermobacter tenebrarum]MBC7101542.1 hypothetical protein [Methanobacteriales archaeon]MBC7118283.1 hypothetical protein [Methanobacteriaceae archaeon]NPV64568.1 hypothetical protein [Methanobacteriaceae archaeon]RAO78701.1 hypothetical protein DPC56_06925 [Methanothermobacter tenebrarum]
MRPETEAKIIVALLISLIAFGCGSCLGIILAISPGNISPKPAYNNTSLEIPNPNEYVPQVNETITSNMTNPNEYNP